MISITPLPFFLGTLYFWGIPFICVFAFLFAYLLRNSEINRLNIRCSFFIIGLLFLQWAFSFHVEKHVGVAKLSSNTALSKNFMLNSTVKKNWDIIYSNNPIIQNSDRRTIYSYFLVDWEPGTEEKLINSDMKGHFVLFGEHDNLNGFIGKRSRFNNDSIQQRAPWNIYKPIMIRDLWTSSLIDPFYCSNIGSTLSASSFLFPIIWTYDTFGIPKILAGTEINQNKIITYFGDTDPAVSFLAPYNASFLKALYKQQHKPDCFKLILLIILLYINKYKNKMLSLSLFLLSFSLFIILTFFDFQQNYNSFDYAIDFNEKILSAHEENNSSFIMNQISRQDNTVLLGKSSVKTRKATIKIIDESKNLRLNIDDLKTRSIIFLQDNASIEIKNITYKAGNIPLGERKDSDIFKVTIPDARIISANGIDCQPILLLEKQCILIGTGSPQRFIDYEELLKCWE